MENNQIEMCTQALLKAIRESGEYKEFERHKAVIGENPEKKRKADEFRRKAYLLQSSDDSIDLLEEMSLLAAERQRLQEDPVVSEYLAAELALCRMVQRISMEIINVTDFQLEGMADVIAI